VFAGPKAELGALLTNRDKGKCDAACLRRISMLERTTFIGSRIDTKLPDPCGFGRVMNARGDCVFGLGAEVGVDRIVGEAVMGRYGAGLVPALAIRQTNECLPGMVLGDDMICYNRGQVPNSRRRWPKGRKPLLTGGEMNAITTAARAARRVKATTKKLQALGMLERPKSRRPPKQPLRLAPAGTSIINVE